MTPRCQERPLDVDFTTALSGQKAVCSRCEIRMPRTVFITFVIITVALTVCQASPQSTPTETAAAKSRLRGQGFALSSSQNAPPGVKLDAQNFCCPDYIASLVQSIKENWKGAQGVTATTLMKFTIGRNGEFTDIAVERSSGFAALDLEATRALRTAKSAPLPAKYANPMLTVHLEFAYQRSATSPRAGDASGKK